MLLAVVAVALLTVGSVRAAKSPEAARTSALESLIKCPQCDDLSIAESDAPSSVQLRHRVATFVAAGWSNGRIESWVTARYGSNALLLPPAGGANETLYVLPAALVALAAAGLAWYLWRRRSLARHEAAPPSDG